MDSLEALAQELEATANFLPGWIDSFRQYHDFQFGRPEEDCMILQHIVPNPSKFMMYETLFDLVGSMRGLLLIAKKLIF